MLPARPQGWVALSGLKYGADPVLYQTHSAIHCARVPTHTCRKRIRLHRVTCAARPQGWVALSGLKYGADLVPGALSRPLRPRAYKHMPQDHATEQSLICLHACRAGWRCRG